MKFLVIVVGIVAMASCATTGEKASGHFTGNYLVNGYSYPGSINITKVSDTKVDMFLVCNYPSVSDYAEGVTISKNGDVISYSYTFSTNVYMDMQMISGTLTGNTVTLDGVVSLSGSSGVGVFTGTK